MKTLFVDSRPSDRRFSIKRFLLWFVSRTIHIETYKVDCRCLMRVGRNTREWRTFWFVDHTEEAAMGQLNKAMKRHVLKIKSRRYSTVKMIDRVMIPIWDKRFWRRYA